MRRSLSEYLPIATGESQQGVIEKLHKFITTNKFDGINLELDHFEDRYVLEYSLFHAFVAFTVCEVFLHTKDLK